ncbi:4'-phosphopantetheinyl transferase superfamily protein [Spongiibacter sp. KMU-166]|uniref:Enterobactin synthase component D n=1 Tax=Spongiibacter thalassae TaxID=2721624 RepID=A0ABX1GBE7_9GAMM|nr:4'-phosphopantetheinyl transferase superfamily protein [Spongiibacter thalassae]NKI15923.1 4'-phosphopantetheinyl transferase superfamily protein [Spongiibacter thalassae]
MLADHFPPDIALVVATDPMQTQRLSEAEEACVANSVEKRKREFRSGRHAAKAALRQLGLKEDINLLPIAGGTRPDWPAGYVGSITHTTGFCAAAVATQTHYQAIAIDVEPRTPIQRNALAAICTNREQQWIAQQPDDHYKADWGKTFFCIKETLYKVFNPIHDVYLDFQEAEVQLSRQDGSFTADIHQQAKGITCRYSGRFGMNERYIYASTLLRQELPQKIRRSVP